MTLWASCADSQQLRSLLTSCFGSLFLQLPWHEQSTDSACLRVGKSKARRSFYRHRCTPHCSSFSDAVTDSAAPDLSPVFGNDPSVTSAWTFGFRCWFCRLFHPFRQCRLHCWYWGQLKLPTLTRTFIYSGYNYIINYFNIFYSTHSFF